MAVTTAFVCAMPMEMRPLAKRLSLRQTGSTWDGTVRGTPVVGVVTGMGTRLAAERTEALLAQANITRVIVFGITGAVSAATPIGSLVLPALVVNSTTGAEFRPEPIGPGEPAGTMWTTDLLLTDPGRLAELSRRGVVSLDMETAAIAEVCERHRIPWSVFRVISDRAYDGSVSPELFALSNQDGTTNSGAVVRYVLRHPGAIPGMARMGRTVAKAADTAAQAAIAAFSRA